MKYQYLGNILVNIVVVVLKAPFVSVVMLIRATQLECLKVDQHATGAIDVQCRALTACVVGGE